MTLYREHYTEDRPNPVPEGWVWAGTDDEFGVLDRWMVPVEEPVYTGDELRAAAAKLHLSGYLARVLVEIGEGGKW